MSKICFFNLNAYSVLFSESGLPIGGTEIQLFNLASYLSEKHEVVFIVSDHGQRSIEKHSGIWVHKSTSLDKKLMNYFRAPFAIWKSLKKSDADVYIASSAGPEIWIIAFFCTVYKRVFVYRTASDIDCNGEFIRKNGLRGRLYRYGLKAAHSVIVQNKENGALLKKNYGIDASVIKNSFSVRSLSEVSVEDKSFILWVGRTEPNKQPELFFELAKKFPNERFVMIAPKQNHLIDYFNEISKRAHSVQNVTFIDGVPFDKIQNYFNKARLLVCTSRYEGFPNVHLQAYAGKAPVVTLNINPDKYITKNNLGYCANGNFEEMEKYIERILSDGQDWEEKSKNAYEYIRKNHDICIIGKQWDNLIQTLLKR